MMTGLRCFECSHETADRALRERVVQRHARIVAGLPNERVCLATCGRLELYVVDHDRALADWHAWIAAQTEQPVRTVRAGWRIRAEFDAARHLLRVASGLRSPILGEDQILGQVRRAFLRAQDDGTLGPVLSALFRAAIHTGRRVRHETRIGAHVRTYAQRAIDALAESDATGRVVVLGTGAVATELIERLTQAGRSPLAIVSRHARRAAALAERVGSQALGLELLGTVIRDADALVACTAVAAPLVDAGCLPRTRVMPLRIVDLGAPRNVAPDVANVPYVSVTTLEDLLGGPAVPPRAVAAAERIVDHEVERFAVWLRARRMWHMSAARWQEAVA